MIGVLMVKAQREKKKKKRMTKAIINSVGMTTSTAHNYHWHALDKQGPRMKSQIV